MPRKKKKNDDKPLIDIVDTDITTIELDEAPAEVKQVEEHLENNEVLSANAALIAEVKKLVTAEIMSDLKEEKVLKEKELEMRRELEDIEYNNYVAIKMESDDPWVDFVGDIRDTEKGQRLEMNWNDAFITFLKGIGITGIDEEQMVQKYISLLLQDMVDKNEDRYGGDFE